MHSIQCMHHGLDNLRQERSTRFAKVRRVAMPAARAGAPTDQPPQPLHRAAGSPGLTRPTLPVPRRAFSWALESRSVIGQAATPRR